MLNASIGCTRLGLRQFAAIHFVTLSCSLMTLQKRYFCRIGSVVHGAGSFSSSFAMWIRQRSVTKYLNNSTNSRLGVERSNIVIARHETDYTVKWTLQALYQLLHGGIFIY